MSARRDDQSELGPDSFHQTCMKSCCPVTLRAGVDHYSNNMLRSLGVDLGVGRERNRPNWDVTTMQLWLPLHSRHFQGVPDHHLPTDPWKCSDIRILCTEIALHRLGVPYPVVQLLSGIFSCWNCPAQPSSCKCGCNCPAAIPGLADCWSWDSWSSRSCHYSCAVDSTLFCMENDSWWHRPPHPQQSKPL
jgi:hypothetical protein